jgi:hypothetical protein
MFAQKPAWAWILGLGLGWGCFFAAGRSMAADFGSGMASPVLIIVSGLLGVAVVDVLRWLLHRSK